MQGTATGKQKRAIRFLLTKFPDTVRPLLATNGGSIEGLTAQQASNIMDAIERQHPRDGGGQNREQQGGEQKLDQDKIEQERQRRREQEQKNEQKLDQNDQKNEQKEQKMQRTGFKVGSKQDVIGKALIANGLDVERTVAALAQEGNVGQIPALTFTENVNGSRRPLPIGNVNDDSQQQTQYGRLRKTTYAVRRAMLSGGQFGEGGQQEQKHEQKQEQNKDNREAADLLAFVRHLRTFCEQRAADGHPLDEIGMRPVEYGAKMLKVGIPLAAIKHAITMHYPQEARRALGVRDYDVKTFKRNEQREGIHAALPYSLALAEARIPQAYVGPKGTGKTTLAKQLSEVLNKPFGMVSMTKGTSPSAFNGRPRVADDGTLPMVLSLVVQKKYDEASALAKKAFEAGDTVVSQFVKIFSGGGVFLFDELDAGDPNLVLGVNSALANGVFANPATGELIEQHPDFIPIAGMNTMGLGAGRDYTGRARLDAASLDRWSAGRIKIDLDPRIEESMFWSIING